MNYQKLADELLRFRAFQQECHESVVRCFETLNMIANMEKETKKMTKAEAFGWLDGKKIRTEGNHEKVLRKLFDLGFVWKNLRDTRVDLGWQSDEVYGLTISDDEVAWWTTPHLFDTHGADAVTAEDVLSIEIVEDTKPDCERNEHVKALQELIAKSGCIDCIIISKNDIGILKK